MTVEDSIVRIDPRFLSIATQPDKRTVWELLAHYVLMYSAWRGAKPLMEGLPCSHRGLIESAVWSNLTTLLLLAVWAHNDDAGGGVHHDAFNNLIQVHAATSDVARVVNICVIHAEVFGILRKSLREQRTLLTRQFDRVWPDADWRDPHPLEA